MLFFPAKEIDMARHDSQVFVIHFVIWGQFHKQFFHPYSTSMGISFCFHTSCSEDRYGILHTTRHKCCRVKYNFFLTIYFLAMELH